LAAEATGNTIAIANVLTGHVGKVICRQPLASPPDR
jgi:hypothetical protein